MSALDEYQGYMEPILTFTGVSGPNDLTVSLTGRELLKITAAGEVIAPDLEAAGEAGKVFVESVRHWTSRPMPSAVKLAEAFRAALIANDEDACVQGRVEGRCTLIDGNFDLIAVAEDVLAHFTNHES